MTEITTYIPTSVLGLLSILFFYLFDAYKKKKELQLQEIQNLKSDQKKAEVIEMRLNEFGTRISTEDLTPEQKYDLLKRLVRNKNQRYLIIAIASILLAVVFAILLAWNSAGN